MATILQQGWFVSSGDPKRLAIRSDVDFINTYNESVFAADVGMGEGPFCAEGYFQRDMAAGTGLNYYKDESNALQGGVFASPNGFTLIDTSANLPRTAVATTATSNVVRPIVLTGNTAGLAAGSVVRMYGVATVPNIMGIDFTIDTIVANTSFRLANGLDNAPGAVGGAGFYRVIAYDPMYYPATRQIISVVAGATTTITCSVSPNYTVGQVVRLLVPEAYGMVELNGLLGTIIFQDATSGVGTITVDIDSSSFTPFNFPLPAAVPFGPAMVVPVGEVANTAISDPNLLDDAVKNVTYIGIELAAGSNSPAGGLTDRIYWVAGKTDNNQQNPLLP